MLKIRLNNYHLYFSKLEKVIGKLIPRVSRIFEINVSLKYVNNTFTRDFSILIDLPNFLIFFTHFGLASERQE